MVYLSTSGDREKSVFLSQVFVMEPFYSQVSSGVGCSVLSDLVSMPDMYSAITTYFDLAKNKNEKGNDNDIVYYSLKSRVASFTQAVIHFIIQNYSKNEIIIFYRPKSVFASVVVLVKSLMSV